ncbi:MAG: hypothetical protein NZ700_15700 [Gemmataceae bacterium]|nr:hypothetical protein [Gemmataceae bacterium]MDW8264010.1 hypothetical protein [Gemmataceae bacterium]
MLRLDIAFDDEEFKKAKLESIKDTPVNLPAQKQEPLKRILAAILEPAGATYQIREGKIWIVPRKN